MKNTTFLLKLENVKNNTIYEFYQFKEQKLRNLQIRKTIDFLKERYVEMWRKSKRESG